MCMDSKQKSGRGVTILNHERLAALEAILFAAGDPISLTVLMEVLQLSETEMPLLVAAYQEALEMSHRGLVLLQVGNTLQLATKPDFAAAIEEALSPVKRKSLSAAVLETLTVIAYRQPITRTEIESIRGVRVDYAVRTLLQMHLIREAGHKDTLGHPLMYGTTDEFLRTFGISNLDALPQLGALTPDGPEAVQERMQLPE